MAAYILLGHGAEHLNMPRHTVPEGSILVVTEECGVLGTIPPHIYEAIQSPELAEQFADPDRYKRSLEVLLRRSIRIYHAGDSYPHMTFRLVNHEQPGRDDDPDELNVGPSGIWPIPSPTHSTWMRPAEPFFDRYTMPADRAGETFRESVFPFDPAERAALAELPFRDLRVRPSLETSADALMAARPGIYYHFLCRSLADPDHNVQNIMQEHFPQAERNLFHRGNAIVAYNAPAVVQDWLATGAPTSPTVTQTAALNRLGNIVRRVMTRRRASRTSSTRRREEPWLSLMRRINHDTGTAESRLELAAAVPAPLINKQESHDGATLLVAAARAGDTRMVRLLLGRGAAANLPDWENMTPLHWAAQVKGDAAVETIRTLLDASADPLLRDEHGNTVMHGATVSAIPLLTSVGVPHSDANAYGSTPLHIAAADGDDKAVSALLDISGIVINARDRDGETPIMLAVQDFSVGARRAVRALVAAGADLTIRSNAGKTTLGFAIEEEAEDSVLVLLAAGAPVADWKMLRRAAKQKHLDTVVAKIDAKLAGGDPKWID